MLGCVGWSVSVPAARCTVCSPYLHRILSHWLSMQIIQSLQNHIVHTITHVLCTSQDDAELFALLNIRRVERVADNWILIERGFMLWNGLVCASGIPVPLNITLSLLRLCSNDCLTHEMHANYSFLRRWIRELWYLQIISTKNRTSVMFELQYLI